jgi:type III restriction enzyme
VENGEVRELDYEQDVLFALDWEGLDPAPLVAKIPLGFNSAERQMRRIRLVDSGTERIVTEVTGQTGERLAFDPSYAVRMVADLVPNAWVAREIVGGLLQGLKARGLTDERLGELHGLVVEELRKWLDGERDRMAEAHFRKEVAEGRIQFRLRTDANNWVMPAKTDTYQPEGAEQLPGKDGMPLQRSLFAPVYKGDLNPDEQEVAVYLDAEKSLTWWHRNVARGQYAIQGWRRGRIFPDFLFAVVRGPAYGSRERLVALEMKGEHLAGNPDTEYKQAVLRLMTQAFEIDQTQRVGELEIVNADGTEILCDLVLMAEWKTRLPAEFLG